MPSPDSELPRIARQARAEALLGEREFARARLLPPRR
jgi:hypothetical protein